MPIEVTNHSTTYTGSDGTRYFQAKALRGSLKLWQAGIKSHRGVKLSDLLNMVNQFTGHKYSRNAVGFAILAMDDWITKNQPEILDKRHG